MASSFGESCINNSMKAAFEQLPPLTSLSECSLFCDVVFLTHLFKKIKPSLGVMVLPRATLLLSPITLGFMKENAIWRLLKAGVALLF